MAPMGCCQSAISNDVRQAHDSPRQQVSAASAVVDIFCGAELVMATCSVRTLSTLSSVRSIVQVCGDAAAPSRGGARSFSQQTWLPLVEKRLSAPRKVCAFSFASVCVGDHHFFLRPQPSV